MKMQRVFLALLAGLAATVLSGCASFGADISMHLRPPKATGEQGLIEQALQEYMSFTLAQENYTLKYPRAGENRSAFLVEDFDGDGYREALAFYSVGKEGGRTHVNLLRRSGEKWMSVDDHESSAADIYSVAFGDVDGDGTRELFVCWDMYSSRTYQLSMYALKGNRILSKFTANCSLFTVADFTGDGRDDCLLFDATATELSAKLWAMNGDTMEQIGQCTAAGYVQQFYKVHTVKASDGRRAVLTDYALGTDTVSTALVYWNGSTLAAPLYDGNVNTYVRDAALLLRDVDGDGELEWPACTPLQSYGNDEKPTELTDYMVTFQSWDFENETLIEKTSCIYNATDGYYLSVEPTFPEAFTTTYEEKTHTLWVVPLAGGEPLLAVRVVEEGEEPPRGSTEFTKLLSGDSATYYVWYAEDNDHAVNAESLRYMLTLL